MCRRHERSTVRRGQAPSAQATQARVEAGRETTMGTSALDGVYTTLREVMERHTTGLNMTDDKPGNTTVESQDMAANGKPRWFGAVQTKKNYVSYHLMPVYEDPSLLNDISPELKARMQGKSCFNFKTIDSELFDQLGRLTATGTKAFEL